jgi:hypothetical protein
MIGATVIVNGKKEKKEKEKSLYDDKLEHSVIK